MTLKLLANAAQGFAGLTKGAVKAELTVRIGEKADAQVTSLPPAR